MNEHDVLCNRCLGLINRRLTDDDLLILVVLRGGDKNMDKIVARKRETSFEIDDGFGQDLLFQEDEDDPLLEFIRDKASKGKDR